MATLTAPQHALLPSFLPDLFVHYITGHITELSWSRLTQALDFDAGETTSEERMAMAAFFDDAALEGDIEDFDLPDADEVKDLLSEMR